MTKTSKKKQTIHFSFHHNATTLTACGADILCSFSTDLKITDQRNRVTCGNCRATKRFKKNQMTANSKMPEHESLKKILSRKCPTKNVRLYATSRVAAAITKDVRRWIGKRLEWREITEKQIP